MSFLGGFSQSLGNYFTQRAAADEERKDWEWKQNKVLELQAKQPVKVELFTQDGKVFSQSVNAAGEPVGTPKPATQFEQQRFERGEKEYAFTNTLNQAKLDEAKSGTRANEARTRRDEEETRMMPAREAREQQQLAGYLGAQGANAAESRARVGLTEAQAERERMINEALKSGDTSVLSALGKGPRQEQASTLTPAQAERVTAFAESMQLDTDDPDVASSLAEIIATSTTEAEALTKIKGLLGALQAERNPQVTSQDMASIQSRWTQR